MYNLSELIKTDCCIDCGSNEKLREVVKKLPIPENIIQEVMPIERTDRYLAIRKNTYATFGVNFSLDAIPLTSINIDL